MFVCRLTDDESKLKGYVDSFERIKLSLNQLKQLRDQEETKESDRDMTQNDDDTQGIRKSKRKRTENSDPNFDYQAVKGKGIKGQEKATSPVESKKAKDKEKSIVLFNEIKERQEKVYNLR